MSNKNFDKYIIEIAKSDQLIEEAINRIVNAYKLSHAIKYTETGMHERCDNKPLIDYLRLGLLKGLETMERENDIKISCIPNKQYFDHIKADLQCHKVLDTYKKE